MAPSTASIQELLERFRRGPELVAVVLTGVAGEEEDYIPAPGKWSIREIAAHLADSELIVGHRFRQVIAEDNPTLIGCDQDAWARSLGYRTRKIKNSLETFRRLRAENHELLRAQPESSWERAGNHTENGRLTLRRLLEIYGEHAETHARQVEEIRAAYKRARANA